jgi:hypothetical protein
VSLIYFDYLGCKAFFVDLILVVDFFVLFLWFFLLVLNLKIVINENYTYRNLLLAIEQSNQHASFHYLLVHSLSMLMVEQLVRFQEVMA